MLPRQCLHSVLSKIYFSSGHYHVSSNPYTVIVTFMYQFILWRLVVKREKSFFHCCCIYKCRLSLKMHVISLQPSSLNSHSLKPLKTSHFISPVDLHETFFQGQSTAFLLIKLFLKENVCWCIFLENDPQYAVTFQNIFCVTLAAFPSNSFAKLEYRIKHIKHPVSQRKQNRHFLINWQQISKRKMEFSAIEEASMGLFCI